MRSSQPHCPNLGSFAFPARFPMIVSVRSPRPVRFARSAARRLGPLGLAAALVLVASGQRDLALDLGPSEPVTAPSAEGPVTIELPVDVAQFEDLDDALMQPVETPTLPSGDFGTPTFDSPTDGETTPMLRGDAPVWMSDATDEAADAIEDAADPRPRSMPEDLSPSRSLKPIPRTESLPEDTADDLEEFGSDGSDDAADSDEPSTDATDPMPNFVPMPGAGGTLPYGNPSDSSEDDSVGDDFALPEGLGESTGPTLPNDATIPAPRRTLRVPSSGVARGEAVRLAIDGRFLGRLFEQSGCTSGAVDDVIMQAHVTGQQTTRTQTRLRLVPDAETARMALDLTGQTRSVTVGATEQADITTQGLHAFRLEKPIAFDGQNFLTRSPGATVWPRNLTTGAQARVGQRVPVVRRMASRIAYEEAQRRRQRSEQIAAQRLTDRVAGEFNTKADAGLGRLQTLWQDKGRAALDRLLESNETLLTSTTDRHVFLRLPTVAMPDTPLPGGWAAAGESMTLAVHETAVNGALAQLALGGRELEQGSWRTLVSALLPSARFASDRPPLDASLATLRLVEDDPVSVRFADGRVNVELRAVVSTPLGESPPQRIVMPWSVTARGDETVVRSDDVEVFADGEESSTLLDVVRAGIETRFAAEVEPVTLRRTIDAPVGESSLPVTLTYYRARDGWLLLGWRAGEPQ